MRSAHKDDELLTAASKPPKQIEARWAEIVLVCRKCSKKLDGGFGPSGVQSLAKALRRRSGALDRDRKPRRCRLGIVEIGCLDICPKGAVLTMRGGAPGVWLAVPAGTPVDEVALQLGLPELAARD